MNYGKCYYILLNTGKQQHRVKVAINQGLDGGESPKTKLSRPRPIRVHVATNSDGDWVTLSGYFLVILTGNWEVRPESIQHVPSRSARATFDRLCCTSFCINKPSKSMHKYINMHKYKCHLSKRLRTGVRLQHDLFIFCEHTKGIPAS